jgi:hypothetical protein
LGMGRRHRVNIQSVRGTILMLLASIRQLTGSRTRDTPFYLLLLWSNTSVPSRTPFGGAYLKAFGGDCLTAHR